MPISVFRAEPPLEVTIFKVEPNQSSGVIAVPSVAESRGLPRGRALVLESMALANEENRVSVTAETVVESIVGCELVQHSPILKHGKQIRQR
jgi:hypothetical protein